MCAHTHAPPHVVAAAKGVGGPETEGDGGSNATGTGSTGSTPDAIEEGIVDLRFSLSASAVCARCIRWRNSAEGSSSKRLKRREAAGSRQQQQQRASSEGRPLLAFVHETRTWPDVLDAITSVSGRQPSVGRTMKNGGCPTQNAKEGKRLVTSDF